MFPLEISQNALVVPQKGQFTLKISSIKQKCGILFRKLIKEFIIDENVADKKFANKIVEINGTIIEISTTNGKGIVTLVGNEANVICQLNEKENKKIMQLKKDQNITIKGQCSGYLMDIMLVNCIIK